MQLRQKTYQLNREKDKKIENEKPFGKLYCGYQQEKDVNKGEGTKKERTWKEVKIHNLKWVLYRG